MLDNLFHNYTQFEAPADDPQLRQWRALNLTVAFPDWLPGPNVVSSLDDFNGTVNFKIRWVDSRTSWQNPVETLQLRTGDCMDIAILKYALMLHTVPKECLGVVLGEIKRMPQNLQHAWLCVETQNRRVVLDSKFDRLIEPDEYINWKPVKLLTLDRCQLFGPITMIAQNQ